MATKLRCNPFELLALESCVSQHPGDRTAALVLVDYLQDHGFTNMGAKQRVAKLVREATEEAQLRRVNEIFERIPTMQRDIIASLQSRSDLPWEVWPTLRVLARGPVPAFVSIPAHYLHPTTGEIGPLEFASLYPSPWVLMAEATRWEISAAHALAIIEELTGSRHAP